MVSFFHYSDPEVSPVELVSTPGSRFKEEQSQRRLFWPSFLFFI